MMNDMNGEWIHGMTESLTASQSHALMEIHHNNFCHDWMKA